MIRLTEACCMLPCYTLTTPSFPSICRVLTRRTSWTWQSTRLFYTIGDRPVRVADGLRMFNIQSQTQYFNVLQTEYRAVQITFFATNILRISTMKLTFGNNICNVGARLYDCKLHSPIHAAWNCIEYSRRSLLCIVVLSAVSFFLGRSIYLLVIKDAKTCCSIPTCKSLETWGYHRITLNNLL